MGNGLKPGQGYVPRIAILAESSYSVGTGHAFEAFALARLAQERGIPFELWLNEAASTDLRGMAPSPPRIIADFSPPRLADIAENLASQGCAVAVTNFRRLTNEQVQALQQHGIQAVVIDELGNTRLDCPLVVNTSIVSGYHHYESNHPDFRLFAGAKYLSLSLEYQNLHEKPRTCVGPIKRVVIAMGGTDRTGSTLNVFEILADGHQDFEIHIALGPGFEHREHLNAQIDKSSRGKVQVHRNLTSLAPLISQCDVGFNMGGNTLYEMACVGTPSIVLYEDEHERRQGMAFHELGAALCLGPTVSIEPSRILAALDSLQDPWCREGMSKAGRSLVDGKGVTRILNLLMKSIGYDSSVATIPG